MSFLDRALGRRSMGSLSDPGEDLIAAFGGQPAYSGKRVTVVNSFTLPPVFRAINILSGAISSMPVEVFRRTGPKSKAMVPTSSRPWELLNVKPNERMAANELWALVQSYLCTWGNAFIWKERGPDGRIANLWPIDPRRVQVGLDSLSKPVYLVQSFQATPFGADYITAGESVVTDDFDIHHIRALSIDGLIGISPIQAARQSLGTMMAQQEFEGRFWANDATPGVTLIHPNKVQPEGIAKIKALWDDAHKGSARARATAVLAEGIEVKQMTMPLVEAQFAEISKMRRTDVALFFGLPPYMLAGEAGGSMTYSNTEMQSLDFVKWSLMPWMKRIEESLSLDPDLMPANWFAKFNADEILRGSMEERYQAWSTAPHLLVDELREMDDLEPLPDDRGQVLAKTIGPPRGTTVPVQDEPLSDQGDEPLDTTAPAPAAPKG